MSLSRTHTLRLAVVLEDCSDKLDILGHTLQIKSVRGSAAPKEITRLTKLKRDCQLISQHISELCSELEEMQTFTSLQQVLEQEKQKKEAGSVRRGERKMLNQRKEDFLSKQEELQQKTEKLKEVHQLAKDLKLQLIEKSSKIANQKTTLVKTFEMQLQQTQKETSHTEKLLEDKVKLLQKQHQEEIRVHVESEIFLQNQNKEFQQKLQQWQEYRSQMQKEKEQQLYKVQCKRRIHLDRLMEKKRLFGEMEQVVVEDRDKLEKLQLQQAETRAAIKLQAWWRGCKVRHGLSFRKPEQNKKGKKKEEKRKKKK
nr:dynein regulatory complex protein 9 [Labrus bergylta]